MDTVHFLGRISPPSFILTTGEPPRVSWRLNQLRLPAYFRVYITNSLIDVECEIEEFRREYYIFLYTHAFDLARIAVDLAAFATGSSVTTILDYFVFPNGTRAPLEYVDDDLAATCTAFRINAPFGDRDFSEIFRIVSNDFELFMALRDLIEANSIPHVAIINCGRVLDGIKRMIFPGVTRKNQYKAWEAMQVALNVSEPYQRWVTDRSINPRHGDRSYISGPEVREALKRTWTIMNRFLEYRKRGNIALTSPDFPELIE